MILSRDLGIGFLQTSQTAESALLQPLERRVNLAQFLFLVLDEAERELVLEIVRAHVGHVIGHGREVAGRRGRGLAQRVVLHVVHVAAQDRPASEQGRAQIVLFLRI